MSYKDPEKQKEYNRLRGIRRRAYFREYRRKHPSRIKPYESHGTSMAYQGETEALKVLVGSKRINRPCDLDWNGKLVDVKTAKPTKTKHSDRWKFLLKKQKHIADLFILICKDSEEKTVGIYLIPNKKIKYSNISFNAKSKRFKKYLLTLQ